MKRIVIGIALLFSGIFSDAVLLAVGVSLSSELRSWFSVWGRLFSALGENRLLVPFLVLTLIALLGCFILLREYFRGGSSQ